MSQIEDLIRAAAARHNVDPETLLQVARIESGLNPYAKNPKSSAGGLFQFIDSTAKQYGITDKFDPVISADAGARLMADNADGLRRSLGRDPTPGELYLAHQQGLNGAISLLSNPDARAADVVGSDAVKLNGGNSEMNAMDFTNLWNGKMGGGRFAGLMAQTPAPSPYEQTGSADQYGSPVPVRTYSANGVGNVPAAAASTSAPSRRFPSMGFTLGKVHDIPNVKHFGSGSSLRSSMGDDFADKLGSVVSPTASSGASGLFSDKGAGALSAMAEGIGGGTVDAPDIQSPAGSVGNPNAVNSQAAQSLLASLMESKKFRPRGLTLGMGI